MWTLIGSRKLEKERNDSLFGHYSSGDYDISLLMFNNFEKIEWGGGCLFFF